MAGNVTSLPLTAIGCALRQAVGCVRAEDLWASAFASRPTLPRLGQRALRLCKPHRVLETIQFMDRLLHAGGIVHGVNGCKRAALVLVIRGITLIAKIVEQQPQAPAYHWRLPCP